MELYAHDGAGRLFAAPGTCAGGTGSSAAAAQEPVPVEPAKKQGEPTIEHKRVRPSETYIAGFGGYTFGGKLSNWKAPEVAISVGISVGILRMREYMAESSAISLAIE